MPTVLLLGDEIAMTLDTLPVGGMARVERIVVEGCRGAALMEMGLTPGADVSVARVAPLGDPIDVLVRGYHLSLRRSEASLVTVVPRGSEGRGR